MDKIFGKTKLPRSRFLVIGIIGLLLVGYAFFSGSLSSDSISGSAEPAVERAKEDLTNRKGIDKEQIACSSGEGGELAGYQFGLP